MVLVRALPISPQQCIWNHFACHTDNVSWFFFISWKSNPVEDTATQQTRISMLHDSCHLKSRAHISLLLLFLHAFRTQNTLDSLLETPQLKVFRSSFHFPTRVHSLPDGCFLLLLRFSICYWSKERFFRVFVVLHEIIFVSCGIHWWIPWTLKAGGDWFFQVYFFTFWSFCCLAANLRARELQIANRGGTVVWCCVSYSAMVLWRHTCPCWPVAFDCALFSSCCPARVTHGHTVPLFSPAMNAKCTVVDCPLNIFASSAKPLASLSI